MTLDLTPEQAALAARTLGCAANAADQSPTAAALLHLRDHRERKSLRTIAEKMKKQHTLYCEGKTEIYT